MRLRNSLENINYSEFLLGTKLCNVHRGGGKFKLFLPGSGFADQIFTGEISGVDSAKTLRQSVFYATGFNLSVSYLEI